MGNTTNLHTGITLLGLGPGDPDLLTRQAWRVLEESSEIVVRSIRHPALAALSDHRKLLSLDLLPGLGIGANTAQLVEKVLELGRRPEGVVYATPGHPLVVDAVSTGIFQRAQNEGISLRIIAGISFIEPVLAALGPGPLDHLALVDAFSLKSGHVPPFPTSVPALITQLSSPSLAAEVGQVLRSLYPETHPVKLIYAGTSDYLVEDLKLGEIDRSPSLGPLTSLYIPSLGPGTSFEAFHEVIAHLRAPDGCPWDREQTHSSLRPHLLEETYELLTALDAEDKNAMREEFGDLLLQILLHAQIASEEGQFNMADILQGIHTKIVYRHPHVFGDVEVDGTQGVLQNWERLKQAERAANGKSEASLLDGVAGALPALVQAEQYQKRAARVGFDWPEIQGVWDKLSEELAEVDAATSPDEQYAEVGDVLFAAVNLARWLKIDPESALRETNARFRQRFAYIEAKARQEGRSVADMSQAEMEALWQAAKKR